MKNAGSSSPDYFLPVRMIWVPLQQLNNDGFFVGHKFNVLYPFRYNTGHVSTTCINNWVSLIPPEKKDTVLDDALEVMPDIWKKSSVRYFYYEKPAKFEDEAFSDRLNKQSAIFVLSHHDGKGRLFFNQNEAFEVDPNTYSIVYTSFPRLAHPSLVVLNACESFNPSLINEIRNYTDVDTIVATTSTIKGVVAGRFYSCLSSYMTGSHQDMPVSKLYDVLQECMNSKTEPDARYLLKDLSYIVIGDENIKLCSPWTASSSGEGTSR
jgi:hypothetical protein